MKLEGKCRNAALVTNRSALSARHLRADLAANKALDREAGHSRC